MSEQYHWLDHLAGFDPELHYAGKLRFSRVVCTGHGKHDAEDIGVIFEHATDREGVLGGGTAPRVYWSGRILQVSAADNTYTNPMIFQNRVPQDQRDALRAREDSEDFLQQTLGQGSVIGWCPRGCREMRLTRETWADIVAAAFEWPLVDFSRHAGLTRKSKES